MGSKRNDIELGRHLLCIFRELSLHFAWKGQRECEYLIVNSSKSDYLPLPVNMIYHLYRVGLSETKRGAKLRDTFSAESCSNE